MLPWPASSSSEPASLPLWGTEDSGPEPSGGPARSSAEAHEPRCGERRRLRLVVAYVGTPFHGFALQRGVTTVAGVLGGALERVLRYPVQLTCAGRTDAGVHAWGQVVSLDVDPAADLERLQRSVNKMLAPWVAVREADWAPPGFDARRWALSRRYRYSLLCTPCADPFRAGVTWHVPAALDLRSMQAASDVFLGEHDFTSFCHVPKSRPGARCAGCWWPTGQIRATGGLSSTSRRPRFATRWSAPSSACSSRWASAGERPARSCPCWPPATGALLGR